MQTLIFSNIKIKIQDIRYIIVFLYKVLYDLKKTIKKWYALDITIIIYNMYIKDI